MFITSEELKKANQKVFNEKVKEVFNEKVKGIWDNYETGWLPNTQLLGSNLGLLKDMFLKDIQVKFLPDSREYVFVFYKEVITELDLSGIWDWFSYSGIDLLGDTFRINFDLRMPNDNFAAIVTETFNTTKTL